MLVNVTLITIVGSYFLGSIPFGFLLVRLFHGEDVRASGSGNIGATNVARRSPALGAATLFLDAGKGLTAVLIARSLFPGPNQRLGMTLAAFCAIAGHLFPVWLRFRGGKGVATSLGSFALIVPKSVLCIVGVFLLVLTAGRYVSLSSVFGAMLFPILVWILHEYQDPYQLLLIAVACLLIIWKHRGNLARIMEGVEPRLGERRG
jgi:acyl phosphate:glycerol-3-phosphate acyltransferase